ncbi:MAG: hypothetical protein ACK53Y_25120, partial [bacterium]
CRTGPQDSSARERRRRSSRSNLGLNKKGTLRNNKVVVTCIRVTGVSKYCCFQEDLIIIAELLTTPRLTPD